MQLETLDLLSILYVFVSLLFAFYLFTVKTKNKTSNILIALFLIVNAQDAGAQFTSMYVYPQYPGLGMVISSSIFLKMPLLYLYVLSVIYVDFKLKSKHFLHLIPLAIMTIVFIPRYYGVSYEDKIIYFETDGEFHRHFEIQVSYMLVHLQIVVYLIASFVAIHKYKKLLLENYSNASLFNHTWLFQFIALFSIDSFVASLKNGFMFLQLETAYEYTQAATSIITLIMVIWIVLKALQSPEIFKGVDSDLQLVKDITTRTEDVGPVGQMYQRPETQLLIDKLKSFMDKHETYLDPSVSVYSLSKKLGMQSQELSLLINRDLNTHFFDFINGYRIQKAMKLLRDPEKNEFTVLEILYEVGFNSKSSFNTAFKKHARTTPTDYRKQAHYQ